MSDLDDSQASSMMDSDQALGECQPSGRGPPSLAWVGCSLCLAVANLDSGGSVSDMDDSQAPSMTDSDATGSGEESPPSHPPRLSIKERVDKVRLPPVLELTAATITRMSGSAALQAKRNRALAAPHAAPVRAALQDISKPEAVTNPWSTPAEVTAAHAIKSARAPTLRAFENSRKRLKAKKTARIAEQRFHSTLAMQEAAFIKAAEPGATGVLIFHGAAGLGVGSRIAGHSRVGGGWMRKMHYQQGRTVAWTPEPGTSKTCHGCAGRLVPARGKKVVDGKLTWCKVNGALECVNPSCVTYACGYTVRSRDPQSGEYRRHVCLVLVCLGHVCMLTLPRSLL